MQKLLWAVCLGFYLTPATSVEIPRLQDYIQSMRGKLNEKLSDLKDNYIVRSNKNGLNYFAHETFRCRGKRFRKGNQIGQILWELNTTKKRLNFHYFDCRGRTLLKESLEGAGVDTFDPLMVALGQVNFSLEVGRYLMTGPDGTQIIEWEKRKNIQGLIQERIAVFGQPIVRLEQGGENKKVFELPPAFVQAKLEGSQWQVYLDGATQRLSFENRDKNDFYLTGEGKPTSKNGFVLSINNRINVFTETVNSYLEELVKRLAVTKIVTSVGSNTRILDELQVMKRRLLVGATPQDLNLVRLKIDEYIAAINSNLIQINDRRPKQEGK
jgi:hypothetical protein